MLVGDYLYGTEDAGHMLVAVEFTTGKVKWQAESIGISSVAYADGFYIFTRKWRGRISEATPEGYREKGRFTPPAQPKRKRLGPYPEKAWAIRSLLAGDFTFAISGPCGLTTSRPVVRDRNTCTTPNQSTTGEKRQSEEFCLPGQT